MGVWLTVIWFGALVTWALWVSEKVRRRQREATRHRHLDIIYKELRRVSERDDIPGGIRAATQGALLDILRRVEHDDRS